ncbi:MAG: sigma-70 family RNA polymerase sigma factor [Polyangiaceae bacterium]
MSAALQETNIAPEPADGAAAPPPSFDAIYEAHFALVWRNLRRLGVPEAWVEDAAQEVFLAIHRRLGDYEGRSSVRTWVFGFVLRVARDHRRRLARKGGGEPLDEGLSDGAPGPHDRLERKEALALLDAALSALDDDKRAVFVMGEIEQMTAPEMAAVLGVPLNTVYSRLRLARRDVEREIARRAGGQ